MGDAAATVRTIAGCRLVLTQGDLTAAAVDAIVNAANHTLLGGGGVDGAIHRGGGAEILAACRRLRAEQWPDGLPTGQAVLTTGGRLPARFVIHTVGPVYSRNAEVPRLLAACHQSSLALAREHGLRTIAFPAISTGIYGYPLDEAAPIALQTTADDLAHHPDTLDEVRFVLFDTRALAAFGSALAELQDGAMRLTRARSLTPLLIGIALAALCIGTARPAAGVTEDEEVAALFREAEAHEASGQWSLASSVYHKIMTEHPENALAHYRFGTIQDKLGASGLALKAYRDAVRLDPDMKEARQGLEGHYLMLARTARAKGQRAETIEALQQAAEANPKSATAPLELGEELERQGSSEGALQAFQKATSADPDDVTARIKLGEALARRGMHERAASEFQQAVRLNPRNAEAHLGLGTAYAELGQRDKAAASLHQAMRFYVIAGDMEKGMEAEALEQKVKAGKSAGAPAPR